MFQKSLFFCEIILMGLDVVGPLYDILWLAFSGEMAEQATKQNVAICCRCKPFHLLPLSDNMHIVVVYQIVVRYFSRLECNNYAIIKFGILAHFWPLIVVNSTNQGGNQLSFNY